MKKLCALLLSLALLSGCQGRPQPTPAPADVHEDNTFFAMDTLMYFTVYGPNAKLALDSVTDRVNELDALLSVTREGSEVWQLNHAGDAGVEAGADLLAVLTASQQLSRDTGGAFDVSLYPVVRAWGFTTGDYQIPDDAEIARLLAHTDCTNISLSGSHAALPPEMEVDFGAIAKGYAGQVCANMLREQGVTSAILRLSGNIQTVGSKPDGSPWRIGIQDPEGEANDSVGILELRDLAAVTSGGYQRFFERDGVRYWHIIDPVTGAPARSGLTSVTIVGSSGTACDALSTALFVMGKDRGLEYWRSHRDFECILIDEQRNIWITPGLADTFSLLEDTGYTLQIVEA